MAGSPTRSATNKDAESSSPPSPQKASCSTDLKVSDEANQMPAQDLKESSATSSPSRQNDDAISSKETSEHVAEGTEGSDQQTLNGETPATPSRQSNSATESVQESAAVSNNEDANKHVTKAKENYTAAEKENAIPERVSDSDSNIKITSALSETPKRGNNSSAPSTPSRPTDKKNGGHSPDLPGASAVALLREDPPSNDNIGNSSVPASPPRVRILSSAPSPARSSRLWLSGIMAKGKDNRPIGPHKQTSSVTTRTLGYDEDEDEETLPESPTGNFDEETNSQDEEKKEGEPQGGGIFCCKRPITNRHLCILAVVLLLAIGAMAWVVHYLHAMEATSPHTNVRTDVPSGAPTVVGSIVPSLVPTRVVPTRAPTASPSTSMPSVSPTDRPSASPSENTPGLHFLNVMARYSTSVLDNIRDTTTKHYKAYDWLIHDPDFFSYSDRRLVQRFVLVLFSYELTLPQQGRLRRQLNWNAMETWRQYTDECLWFTSYYDDRVGCDRTGLYKRLVLINLGLQGTIPTELTLLSRLEALILPNNTIVGTIPKALGNMASLINIDLSGNKLVGTIPPQIANLPQLAYLDVGNNTLDGPVPSQLCWNPTLTMFKSDCIAVQCPCCTNCTLA